MITSYSFQREYGMFQDTGQNIKKTPQIEGFFLDGGGAGTRTPDNTDMSRVL